MPFWPGIILAFALTSLSATAAPTYQVPSGARPVEVIDDQGTHAAFDAGQKAQISLVGPGRVTMRCYLPDSKQVTLVTTLAAAEPVSHSLQPKKVAVQSPTGLRRLAKVDLDLAPGPQVLDLSSPGCVVAFDGASLATTPTAPADVPRRRTVSAQLVADAEAPPSVPSGPSVAASVPPPTGAPAAPKRIRVALRLGALVPRTELGAGFALGADAAYLLPVLDQRLRIQVGFGYSLSPYQGARIVPGRGYDPHFTQNTTLLPLDVSAVFEQPLGSTGLSLYGGLGLGVLFVDTTFQSFDATTHVSDTTFAPLVQVGLAYPLGPGTVLVDARYTEATADLGPLGLAGQDAVGNFLLTGGYALRF